MLLCNSGLLAYDCHPEICVPRPDLLQHSDVGRLTPGVYHTVDIESSMAEWNGMRSNTLERQHDAVIIWNEA